MNPETIRLSAFFSVICLMFAWQYAAPRRLIAMPHPVRKSVNLSITFLNASLISGALFRLMPVLSVVSAARIATEKSWGLFNNFLTYPDFIWVKIIFSVVLLDLVIYWQHRLFHWLPTLWSLHKVHHSDPEFDTTTALRFHPLEILLSLAIKFAAVVLIGAPPESVLIFEVLLNSLALFNHGNVRMPVNVDKFLRFILVTPDMHRIHHSVLDAEMQTNFGFQLSVWDRWFGSWTDSPAGGHTGMKIGLEPDSSSLINSKSIKPKYFSYFWQLLREPWQ